MDHRILLHLVSVAAYTRAGNPNIGHCYHGYFCAGAGGMSGKLGERGVHEVGGMKAEVALREHRAGRTAFIKENGADAYKARSDRLNTTADRAAGKMTEVDAKGLASERDHLIQLLANGTGTRTEQQQWHAEASMIQQQLGRALLAQRAAVAKSEKAAKAPSATAKGKSGSHRTEHAAAKNGAGHDATQHGMHAAQSFLHFLEKIIAEFSAGMHEASHVTMGGGGGGGGGR